MSGRTVDHVETTFGEDFRGAVRLALEEGHTLANRLGHRIAGRKFRVRGLVPIGTVAGNVPDLRFSIGAKRSLTLPWVVRRITDSMTTNENSFVVFESSLGRRGDPYLQKCVSETLYFRDEVLHAVFNETMNEDRVLNLILESDSALPRLFGAVIDGFAVEIRDRDVGPSDIERMANATVAIVLGVWDGEAFLFCDDIR